MNEDFDWEFYISFNKDLEKSGINTKEKAIKHYNKFGKFEKRVACKPPNNFDWKIYLSYNKDLEISGINTEEKAIEHYLRHGIHENRKINDFEYTIEKTEKYGNNSENKFYSMLRELKNSKNKSNLCFIHIPKCAGTYVRQILKNFDISCKHHAKATKNDGITFAVVRDPIERFESLLNYRLSRKPTTGWPSNLNYVYDHPNISLNEIVSKMTDQNITSFTPYCTLVYWCENVDVVLTINNLNKFLNYFGYNYNPDNYVKKNVSKKTRGTFNEHTKQRIANLFKNDVILFKDVLNNQP